MVLPDRIELSTSPFITLTLSRPPHAAFVRWTIPSPWSDLCWTLGVARLVSTPSPKGLAGIAVGMTRTVSPTLGDALSTVSDRAGNITKGVLYH